MKTKKGKGNRQRIRINCGIGIVGPISFTKADIVAKDAEEQSIRSRAIVPWE